jgi:hypothetical protein
MERTQRGVIIGRTGCGKTTLAHYLLRPFRYVMVYDPKNRLHWPHYVRYTTLRKVVDSEKSKIIYAPKDTELDDPDLWYAFFEMAYKRCARIKPPQWTTLAVYVDEVYAVTRGQILPRSLFACLTRGREFGLSILTSTQRPSLLPNTILSEADNTYIFNLQLRNDRIKVQGMIPVGEEQIAALPPHHFIFYRDGERTASSPLMLDLGSNAGSKAS